MKASKRKKTNIKEGNIVKQCPIFYMMLHTVVLPPKQHHQSTKLEV
jgi:hypothetical protein